MPQSIDRFINARKTGTFSQHSDTEVGSAGRWSSLERESGIERG